MDASAKLGGSGVSVVSAGSASVESQGSLALSVDESWWDGKHKMCQRQSSIDHCGCC